MIDQVMIKPITADYQDEAKGLVLEGMKERFGFIDHTLNPDLNILCAHYSKRGNAFYIGFIDNNLICTGALTKECTTTGRIERMSVKKAYRRNGIAQLMLEHLELKAKQLGYSKIVLETNQLWNSAITFYKKNGFKVDFQENERIHFFKKMQ
ncbi:GNAT family N-acetyltransferase [Virgibacillus necropolis]|uniref:GNAT family N-acetyltransferase n=1 Tax=Virgibacillus necropolis TaxID=163877 RepID=UPI00384F9A45